MPEVNEDISSRKLRGGFYTPEPVADFITKWAIQDKKSKILEPSCGDGIFLESAIARMKRLGALNEAISRQVFAVEFYEEEARKAALRTEKLDVALDKLHVGDFFKFCFDRLSEKELFDVVLGNPPFIRYQNFPEEQRRIAFAIMKRAGLNPSKLINTWIPFLIASTLLLKSSGRIGMVIPAELFQVNYSASTRLFLSETYSRITIIAFKKLIFKGIQQEVVLLLGERNGRDNHGIKVVELNDEEDLKSFDPDSLESYELKDLDHSSDKWTQYFLDGREIGLLRKLKARHDLPVAGEMISVDVGLVTGQNKFFVLPEEKVKKHRLENYTRPILGKTSNIKGIVFTGDDFANIVESGQPSFLFAPPSLPFQEFPSNVKDFIKEGEDQKLNEGYKCQIRKEWWVVPSVWIPDGFILRQVNSYPKLILNETNATSTDTIHRVRFINGKSRKQLASSFLNSLTLAFSEVTGRSYGGGVLTFEPSESEKLPLPNKYAKEIDFNKIDGLVRQKKITEALDMNDEVLLKKGLGLDKSDMLMLRGIWEKLRDRRQNRH